MDSNTKIQYSKIGVISLAHLLNDLYSNYVPQLLPFLVVLYDGFTATKAAIVVSAFTITASFTQPFLGYFMDRTGNRRLTYLGTLWMSILLSLTGIVNNYILLVVLAALAGLGTAVFHPQASSMVNVLSGDHKSVLQSGFLACGSIGTALGPLLLIPLFQTYGLQATVITCIPGIIVTILLFLYAPKESESENIPPTLGVVMSSLKTSAKELSALVGVVAVRSLTFSGLIALLPLYFHYKNLTTMQTSHLITILLASGVIGGLVGGLLADRYGVRLVIIVSLLLTPPLFIAFLLTTGLLSTVFLALAGATLMASFSATTVAAQETIPNNKALAAGLVIGFAGGLGGIFVVAAGRIGDVFGLTAAVIFLFCVPILGAFLGFFLKKQQPPQASPRPS
ncbi:MAG TPA: MFS transporter [Anaerovoracaceae bacterium]|nr:MFS transporter [Anaerovoracaceae bacterium]